MIETCPYVIRLRTPKEKRICFMLGSFREGFTEELWFELMLQGCKEVL
jgi:hypothetical protein